MFLGCYELWMLRVWMLRILDATVLDALIVSPCFDPLSIDRGEWCRKPPPPLSLAGVISKLMKRESKFLLV